MRKFTASMAALGTLLIAACGGSEVQEPVEQIIIAEPGEAASAAAPEQAAPPEPEQPAE